MTLEEFRQSIALADPPAGLPPLLEALWRDARGDWDAAHNLVQEGDGDAARVHAYLHRREGDPGNARYWYARARRPAPTTSLDQEWEQIVTALLASAQCDPSS